MNQMRDEERVWTGLEDVKKWNEIEMDIEIEIEIYGRDYTVPA